MGNDLVSLILFGHTGQDLTADNADPIRILIVLESVDAQSLDQLSTGYQTIGGRRRLSPMIMTVEEMESSTDVFPITFLEMQQNYCVLAGTDVLANLTIRFDHLRLRCEQELKNLLLRMQNRYLTQHDDNRLAETFRSSIRSFIRSIGAALNLVDSNPKKHDQEIVELAAKHFELDLEQTMQVFNARNVTSELRGDQLRSLYAVLMNIVSQAASAIDHLPGVEVTVVDVTQ